jgi:hypothetical protein
MHSVVAMNRASTRKTIVVEGTVVIVREDGKIEDLLLLGY